MSWKFLAHSSPGRSRIFLYFRLSFKNLKSSKYQKALFLSSTPIVPPGALRMPSRVDRKCWACSRTLEEDVYGSFDACIISVSSIKAKSVGTRAEKERADKIENPNICCLIIDNRTVLMVT